MTRVNLICCDMVIIAGVVDFVFSPVSIGFMLEAQSPDLGILSRRENIFASTNESICLFSVSFF